MAQCGGENVIFGEEAISLEYHFTMVQVYWNAIRGFFKGIINAALKAMKG